MLHEESIALRVPGELKALIEVEARGRMVSVALVVREILVKHFDFKTPVREAVGAEGATGKGSSSSSSSSSASGTSNIQHPTSNIQ